MNIDPKDLDWDSIHELFLSVVIPRPIAFVSTIGEDGVFNLAPFATFATLCSKPFLVHVNIGRKKDGQKKDTLVNIEFSKDFVINIVTETLAKEMKQASDAYPSDVDEFQEVGLTPAKADLVKSPLVAESPVNMECKLVEILKYGDLPKETSVVIGEVVRIHIKDELYVNGEIQVTALQAIGRIGDIYCRTTDIIEI